MPFKALGLHPLLVQATSEMGFTEPTPVQSEGIPAILAGNTPLGRILIEHNVLRRIAPIGFLQVKPGVGPEKWFGAEPGRHITYGRLGVIYFDEQPAIEVLEIVAPV